ncbi:MAG: hypothetical protein A3A33_01270 [Candidatus Yanofskybacteria bacterium RIFCSPLOWO2_01_FULL_49_25]|uniref:Uncharacterized protein n=1 Tax=Candidatus Yanofskybacteria bacterium RIFCSPLOWO2_01_FULL_49_25 TaxID=1802701 RepID=A0A1F8GZ82_9BACT|nr:MAG: hypothetical protein A3A33_01270 [Candidatus Yanofskybacteria bacterium RIFCSPLOWO2_01_FULL_49_25]
MSLAINVTTPEGIVLAADSRQSYRNQKGVSRVGSDSASKLFLINDRIGVAVTGLAFLPENGVLRNVSKFIEDFKREASVENLSVKEVAEKLHYLFGKKLNWEEQLEKLPDQIRKQFSQSGHEVLEINEEKHRITFKVKDPQGNIKEGVGNIDGVILFVAGYNKDGAHEVYNVYMPGDILKRRDSNQRGMEYGANWIGQTDVVSRIVKGWDPRILNLPVIATASKQQGQQEIEKQLNGLEYSINWGAMPLQDAVDFTVLAIETTSAIQRFSDGIQSDPGDIPGVGGPVDVLILAPVGPKWVRKKQTNS